MKEIVNRLQEQRQIELAKSILESKGYKISERRAISTEEYVWNKEPNRFYEPGEPKEFLYYAPKDIHDRRTVVYGQVYYPSKYEDYAAEVIDYPEAVYKVYCATEEDAIGEIEKWFSDNK